MKCRDCIYMHTNDTAENRGLYICINFKSDMLGQMVGFCCEDECEYGKPYYTDIAVLLPNE